MEVISLSIIAAAAGSVLNSLLGDQANKLVSTIAGAVIGSHADRLISQATDSSWQFFKNLRSSDPLLNHDLERATREAYLLATRELVRQAELQTEVGTYGSRLMTSGDAEALAMIRQGIEADLRNIANSLPQAINDVHLFLVDASLPAADRMERLQATLRENLVQDLKRWLQGRDVPAVIDRLVTSGWRISTSIHKDIPRDWFSLIALAFVEKLKTSPRLATIFESQLLARIAAREPAAAPIASFAGFTATLDSITTPLQRIEDALGIVGRDVSEIKSDVKDIKHAVSTLERVPRLVWVSSAVMVIAAATVFATDAGTRVLCHAPGVKSACSRLGIGGVPSAAEEQLWRSRTSGDCGVLQAYLERYPGGAYATEATRRLAAAVSHSTESWMPQEKTQVLTIRASVEPSPSDQAAKEDALKRAVQDAQLVCAPYSQDEYRLRSTKVKVNTWRCSTRDKAVFCGFDGVAICAVDARRLDAKPYCK